MRRLEGWLAHRRTRLADSWGEFSYWKRVRRRGLAEGFWTSLVIVLAVPVGIAIGSFGGTPDPTDTHSPAPIIDMAPRVDVPDVRGMSAGEAGSLLERAGLKFERAIAAEGTPGRVLGTLPRIDRSVSSGTPVTLIVGVDAERLVAGLLSSVWSEAPASERPVSQSRTGAPRSGSR